MQWIISLDFSPKVTFFKKETPVTQKQLKKISDKKVQKINIVQNQKFFFYIIKKFSKNIDI
jgi:hypothetical protein